jgi:outer membrane protein TolC
MLELDLEIQQPLLRNFGFRVNYASIDILGFTMRQADARTRLMAIRILANAEQAYWRYFAAYENLKIQVRQYELGLEQLRNAEKLVRAGVVTKVENITAAANLAQRFSAVIQAELQRLIAERQLKTIMNRPDLPVTGKTIILPDTPPAPMNFLFNRPRVLDLSLTNRMELFENELQLLIDETNILVSGNLILPDVRLDYKYSFIGSGPDWATARHSLFGKAFDSFTLGLTAEVPLLGNVTAQGQYRANKLRWAQTTANRMALQLSISRETLDAIDAVEQDWERVRINRVVVARNQENYQANIRRWQQGQITGNELILTQNQLTSAQSDLVTSLADFQNAMVDLAFATGTILGESGVIWHLPPVPPAPPIGSYYRRLSGRIRGPELLNGYQHTLPDDKPPEGKPPAQGPAVPDAKDAGPEKLGPPREVPNAPARKEG